MLGSLYQGMLLQVLATHISLLFPRMSVFSYNVGFPTANFALTLQGILFEIPLTLFSVGKKISLVGLGLGCVYLLHEVYHFCSTHISLPHRCDVGHLSSGQVICYSDVWSSELVFNCFVVHKVHFVIQTKLNNHRSWTGINIASSLSRSWTVPSNIFFNCSFSTKCQCILYFHLLFYATDSCSNVILCTSDWKEAWICLEILFIMKSPTPRSCLSIENAMLYCDSSKCIKEEVSVTW